MKSWHRAKKGKITKPKSQAPSGDNSSTAKPSLYNKVTRKSSVVPLESKPFLRKGSRIASVVSPAVKSKVSSLPEESLKDTSDVIKVEENELVTCNLSPVCLQSESNLDPIEVHSGEEAESQLITPEKCGDTESTNQIITSFNDSVGSIVESALKTDKEEESVISPAAWVEVEDDDPIEYNDRSTETATVANVVAVRVTSPRVRHSLSQMLLEETSEPDAAEWGNAENPPAVVYQKDAPKGLKRLLKFARKSKLDAQSSGWSSPSGFSEGEDEAEESKTSKKYSENLLRKAALNAKNYGPQRSESYESYVKYSAQSGVNNSTAQKMQEGHAAASATTSKTTRSSFFSLSAFKGSKPMTQSFDQTRGSPVYYGSC